MNLLNLVLLIVCKIQLQHEITVGDIISAVSILITIVIFWIQLYKTRIQNHENQKASWYLNVIILPQFDKIDQLYINIIKSYENARKKIDNAFREDIPIAAFLNLKSQEIRNIKTLIDEFYNNLSCLIKSYDENISFNVDQVSSELEDLCSTLLDSEQPKENYKLLILENKEKLIKNLNKEIKKS